MNRENRAAAERDRLVRKYTTAVTRSCPPGRGASKGVLAACSGYTDQELADLPADAVENSFGCGSPLAACTVRIGDVVLDLGCGAGIDLILAARLVGPTGRVIGIDMTDAMVARARLNVAAAGHENVLVRKGVIEDLPVATASVDWVISNCVLTLALDRGRVLGEVLRVLEPGGQLVFSDLVAELDDAILAEHSWMRQTCLATAVCESDYIAGLAATGFAGARVLERTEYAVEELAALLRSELEDETAGEADILGAARSCVGAVHSARITASKPR